MLDIILSYQPIFFIKQKNIQPQNKFIQSQMTDTLSIHNL